MQLSCLGGFIRPRVAAAWGVLLLLARSGNAVPHNCNVRIVPAAASAHGLAGTYFRTDLWVLNQSSYPRSLYLSYQCVSGCPAPLMGVEVLLPPGGSRQFSDVVATVFTHPESNGAILISECSPDTPDPFFATSRTYTDAAFGNGTMGASVPAYDQRQQTTSATFLGLASNAGDLRSGFRTNVGVVSTYATVFYPISVRLTLKDFSGAAIASGSLSVGDPVQINDVFAYLGVSDLVTTNATLLVESDEYMLPYVTVIDNQSGDSVFLPFVSGL